jgi:hypothetical protein
MRKGAQRARYTLKFKQEAVRLVEGGQIDAAKRAADRCCRKAPPLGPSQQG